MTTSTVADIVRLGPVIPVLAFETPEQGEHTESILAEFGYDAAAIDGLP